MASQASIAESTHIVTSDELNYEQKAFSHSQTKINAQFPNTFGQPINLGASQTPVTINIPPEVFNLGEADLNYKLTIPNGTDPYIWYHRQALPGVSHIQYYANNSMYILDLDNVNNYADITIKAQTSREDFLSLDYGLNNGNNYTAQNNSVVNVVPALRCANVSGTDEDNLPAFPSSVNYTEPAYFDVSDANGDVVLDISFKLKLLKNTWFSCAKEMYCPLTTYLKIYFGPVSKICYESLSNASPSASVKRSYTGIARVENLQLMLPIECNENIRALMMNKVQNSGLQFIIPYPVAFKNSNKGPTQTISIQFDSTNGQTLQRVIHAVYANTEDLDMAFDHKNNDVVTGARDSADQKVLAYYTMLNGKRQQDLTLDCTYPNYYDYLQNKKHLEGSIISNLNVYQYNWHHMDDYCQFGADYDQHNTGNLIAGVPLGLSPLTWAFYGQTMRPNPNNQFQHYTWAIFSKKMMIQPTGQIIVE